ncbi:MAG: phosphoenolpyruvate kinase [Gemmatimonadota bacterium]
MSAVRPTLSSDALAGALARLDTADARLADRYPGEPGRRQPVHTVYGGGHLFRAATAERLGDLARRSLDEFAPDPAALAQATGMVDDPPGLVDAVHARVREKLETEPVEDFRIDFEDGYGHRADAEEDGHVVEAAAEVAEGLASDSLPPFLGLRVKPLSPELRARSVRTLDLFVTALVERSGGELPDNWVFTLPKITDPAQPAAFAELLGRLEEAHGLDAGSLRFELMVETPRSIFAADGSVALPALVEAGAGRVTAAHFGTYDYTALLGITASEQRMRHPACDFARDVMKVALAGTEVWISDGSTAVLPVPPHRAAEGAELGPAQRAENRAAVHAAWRMHFDDVTDSLVRGLYQGWDLHPAQLVTRYAAVYGFFLGALDAAADRLANFLERAAQATLLGNVFDDAATGQGLLNFFLRAVNSGAVSEDEALARTGLTQEELATRSFVEILKRRGG